MKLERPGRGSRHGYDISQAVDMHTDGWSDDTIHRIDEKACNTAALVGRLVEVLHRKGLLSDEELLEDILEGAFEMARDD